MRAHVRRVRELISVIGQDAFWMPNALSAEHLSPTLLPFLVRGLPDSDVPDSLLKTQPVDVNGLYQPLETAKSPRECLRSLAFSAWNPPQPNRLLAGDLAYLVATTPEARVYHITAHTQGFYANRCENCGTFSQLYLM
jgi:hypothetical protein